MKNIVDFKPGPGMHIAEACEIAVSKADKSGKPVHFEFNETPVTVQPGEAASAVVERWGRDRDAAHEAYLKSPEYAERQRKEAEELQRKMSAHMTESATSETEMREAKVPWPYTKEQLIEYIGVTNKPTNDQSLVSVIYRDGPITVADYDEVIAELKAYRDELEKWTTTNAGYYCPCGDTCTPGHCHHDALHIARHCGAYHSLFWRCFHCGAEFSDEKLAQEHFGPNPDATPTCLTGKV